MLADLIAGEDISKHCCYPTGMKFQRSYFKQVSDKDCWSLIYKKPDEQRDAENGEKLSSHPFIVVPSIGLIGCSPFKFDENGEDGTTEIGKTIENNLTYDGYCVLLGMLSDEQLLRYQDSITQGINNEAKASLLQTNSISELKSIQEDFLQLKAASEYLINKAEANVESQQFNVSDEMISTISDVMQDFEK